MSLGSIIGIAISSYIPGVDTTVGAMIGGSIGNLVESGIKKAATSSNNWANQWIQRGYSIIIYRSDDDIYNKLERYIVRRHLEKVHTCTLQPDNGEIVVSLKDAVVRGKLIETWNKHTIHFDLRTEQISSAAGGTGISEKQCITIRSSTATVTNIQEYIEHICQYRDSSRCLRIYRAVVESTKDKKQSKAYWSLVNTLTNKRISNTILNESAEKELYNDVKWFLNNQQLYDTQGIPYKRGYLLYGIPGTGKTSCIKAIANEYHLDIFSIQMNDLEANSQFTLLMTRITELTGNRPYILALEDFDRSDMFDPYSRKETTIGFGTILNELDGVTESFGRLLFITANSRERFHNREESDALFRPGRVDKEIELGYCDKYQLEKMVNHFANVKLDFPLDVVPKQITPAKVISVLQRYIGGGQDELQQDIKNWCFWTEISNNDVDSSTTLADKALTTLQRRINTTQRKIRGYNRVIKRATRSVNNIDRTTKTRNSAKVQLKKLRDQLSAKRKKAKLTGVTKKRRKR